MPEPADRQLLDDFAQARSEAAFAALVSRHVNLVFSTAFRFTGNTHRAEEVTQAVFIILARKAPRLSRRVILSGWLYQVARLTAANLMKRERRRQDREQEAYMQSTLNEPNDDGWREIAPLLDDAMGQLGRTDRDAVVLRYFENKSSAEIAAALQMTEETARKRVNRALAKLLRYFHRRGIASPTAVIAGALSSHSVQAAPAALKYSIPAAAVANGSAANSTQTLAQQTLRLMQWTHFKPAFLIGTVLLLAAGTGTLWAQHESQNQNRGLPYRLLDDAVQFSAAIDQSKFRFVVSITSHNKNVHPADIHLTIQSTAKGPIPFQLGPHGEITNLVHDAELRRENPRVVSDQPKGSLSFNFFYFLPPAGELTFPYHRLTEEAAEVNKAIALANTMIKNDFAADMKPYKHHADGLIFAFPPGAAGNAKISVAAAAGRRQYVADRHGIIHLKLDPALSAEDPQVNLSTKPRYIVPDLPHP